ncbi:MAG: corrinoid protein [Alphaproteobacteria bacterium]|jgi:5-methyltetrahydrofolate--homocysteine methyltransferase|nr:corrinoid protein [Alphaproteobacteria bacterium]MDP6588051.1 corrinoid protein [Alphaproteobacteria bacterium]MDP6818088.1 corrinoid protein [Alphaproteobacteria bacterium]|tara:strand:- start:92 stop:727 length:636 start_codon:yes stop_codon:yes gene_type:complete
MPVDKIYEAVLDYDDDEIAGLVTAELAAGTAPQAILDDGLVAALDTVGAQFSEGTLFVPEMLMAADTVKAGLDILRPILAETGMKPIGTVVIGTVKGDLHDIGKNLVSMVLEGAGFRIVDLGTDVEPQKFVDAALENNADIVALSALLTTSMAAMERAVGVVSAANETSNLNVRILVGGPPVTDDFAAKIGADGYGVDAPTAVGLARGFVQ